MIFFSLGIGIIGKKVQSSLIGYWINSSGSYNFFISYELRPPISLVIFLELFAKFSTEIPQSKIPSRVTCTYT